MVLRLFHQAALAFVSLVVIFYQHFFFVNHPRAPELMSLNGWVNMEFYLLLINFFFFVIDKMHQTEWANLAAFASYYIY